MSACELMEDTTLTDAQRLAHTVACVKESRGNGDVFYILWASALIFLMQAGFATLSAGSIRQKNVKNILLKNLLDACMGAMTWFIMGYGFAYDKSDDPNFKPNSFIGSGAGNFALSGYLAANTNSPPTAIDFAYFQFQFAFAAAAATIVSGAVAERCQLSA